MEIVCIKSKFLGGSFDQNTYVVTKGKEALIVDASAEPEEVLLAVGKRKVVGIILSHIHFDHIWNLQKYLDLFNAKVYVCKNQEQGFIDGNLNASLSFGIDFSADIDEQKIGYLKPKMKLGNFEPEIIFTPGHSADSVCVKLGDVLFCGDTLFYDGVGRTDLTGGDHEELVKSLEKIGNLNFKTALPGHSFALDRTRAELIIKRYK